MGFHICYYNISYLLCDPRVIHIGLEDVESRVEGHP